MAEISKIIIPVGNSTQTFEIKDSDARSRISSLETTIGDINDVLEEVL